MGAGPRDWPSPPAVPGTGAGTAARPRPPLRRPGYRTGHPCRATGTGSGTRVRPAAQCAAGPPARIRSTRRRGSRVHRQELLVDHAVVVEQRAAHLRLGPSDGLGVRADPVTAGEHLVAVAA